MPLHHVAIAIIAAIQFALLTIGFSRYGTHPDELGYRVIEVLPWDQWRPLNYYYPTTHQYFLKLVTILIGDTGHFILGLFPDYGIRLIDKIGRIVTSLMAIGCSVLAYTIVRASGHSRAMAMTSMALSASFPLMINLGRFNTTDVPNLVWLMLAMWLTIRATQRTGYQQIILAGACTGLAIGVKYLAALALPGFLLALVLPLLKSQNFLQAAKVVIVHLSAVTIAFIVSTPLAVLDFASFIQDIQFLRTKVPVWAGEEKPIGGLGVPLQVIQVLNPVILTFAIIGLVSLVQQWRKPISQIILATLIVYYLFMFNNHFYPLRFLLPVYGLLLLSAAFGIDKIYTITSRARQRVSLQITFLLLVSLGIGLQFRESAAITYNFVHETRYQAAQYLKAHLNPTQKVALPTYIHTYFPVPFLPETAIFDSATSTIRDGKPQLPDNVIYGITSSLWNPDNANPEVQLQEYVQSNWTPVQTYETKTFLGKKPEMTEFLCPTVTIYKRVQE